MKNSASKQSKTASIVAGGVLSERFLPAIRASRIIVGVDRGALWLVTHGIVPDIAIGDFDSVTLSQKQRIHDNAKKYIEYLPEKDMTDLELAIEEVIRMKPHEVNLYGVLGKRFDHTMGAIQLLARIVSHNINGEIVDNFNKIHIVRRLLSVSAASGFRYLSIMPLTNTVTVSLTGFVYGLTRQSIASGSTLGISNEILAEHATIVVHAGHALVIQSNDLPVR